MRPSHSRSESWRSCGRATRPHRRTRSPPHSPPVLPPRPDPSPSSGPALEPGPAFTCGRSGARPSGRSLGAGPPRPAAASRHQGRAAACGRTSGSMRQDERQHAAAGLGSSRHVPLCDKGTCVQHGLEAACRSIHTLDTRQHRHAAASHTRHAAASHTRHAAASHTPSPACHPGNILTLVKHFDAGQFFGTLVKHWPSMGVHGHRKQRAGAAHAARIGCTRSAAPAAAP